MDWLVDAYRQVPAELRTPLLALSASLITALAAVAGIVLSNVAAARRQRADLRATEARALVQRDLELRKALYLETLEAFGATAATVTSAWHIDRPLESSAETDSKSAAMAFRTYLVANDKTIGAVLAASQVAGNELANAMPIRLHHQKVRGNQKLLEGMIERLTKQAADVRAQLDGCPSGDEKRAQLEAERERVASMLDKAMEHMFSMVQGDVKQSLKLVAHSTKSRARFDAKVWNVIVAMREELALPIDSVAFLDAMTKAAEESTQTINSMIDESTELLPSLFERPAKTDAKI